MFEADFGRSHGWHRPKCRLQRSVRPVGRDEGTREAGGLPGEKTFGDFWSFKSHSPQPEGRAKPLRGQSPRLFDAEPHQSDWRAKKVSPLTLALSHKGRGDQSADHRGLRGVEGKRHKQKPQPKGCGFFIGSTCWHQTPTRPTGLRRGASWSCRRCLPARCPSR